MTTIELEVPKKLHSQLIGKGVLKNNFFLLGVTIKQLQKDSGAYITIPKSTDASQRIEISGF